MLEILGIIGFQIYKAKIEKIKGPLSLDGRQIIPCAAITNMVYHKTVLEVLR